MAVFQETTDAGSDIFSAAGIVSIPEFDKIEGVGSDSVDVDVYELKFDKNETVNIVNLDLPIGSLSPLKLLNEQGSVLSDNDNEINFSGEAGETVFLQVGEPGEIGLQVLRPYEIALNITTNDLTGTDGDDILTGTSNSETIRGLNGNDTLIGGQGSDRLIGEGGKDIFKYSDPNESQPGTNSRDNVSLNRGFDRIDLSEIDANLNLSGNQSFNFVGTSSFDGVSGQVRYDALDNVIQAEIQGDGNRTVDLEIQSSVGFSSLSASDFIL